MSQEDAAARVQEISGFIADIGQAEREAKLREAVRQSVPAPI